MNALWNRLSKKEKASVHNGISYAWMLASILLMITAAWWHEFVLVTLGLLTMWIWLIINIFWE